MKNLLILTGLLISLSSYSQSFDGVPISGDLNTAVSRFKAKGYTVLRYLDQGVQLKGKVANRTFELFILVTPKTKKVFKMTLYLDEASSWTELRSTYFSMLETLTNKYGEPDES